MAKEAKWTTQERKKLFGLLDQRKSYETISEELKRSIYGIKMKIWHFKYVPKCLTCGGRMINKKLKRLNGWCELCISQHIKTWKKEYRLTPQFKLNLKNQLNKHRFGSLRELVIKRDGEKCVKCEMTREEHYLKFGCDITVDHKNGKGRNSKEKDHG